MACFNSRLSASKVDSRIWCINLPLIYKSDLLDSEIVVPTRFHCDFESVDRLLLLGYVLFAHTGDEAGVIHDYLYRKDCEPRVSRAKADAIYREACLALGNSRFVAWSKWAGVRAGGWTAWKKKTTDWKPSRNA
jgi:hypothetical protein